MRIIHMFNWRLNDIKDVLPLIDRQGFDAIQINPIQPLKEDNYNLWWLSYQPCSFSIGNIYGTKEDLASLCTEARKYQIDIIADVICNHTAGLNNGKLYPHEKVDHRLTNDLSFWKSPQNIHDWHNRQEVITYCIGVPGLNLNNHALQNIIIKFLQELLNCGVRGFRFDAAKNIALPEEGCDFWPRILYYIQEEDVITYAEVIFEQEDLLKKYTTYLPVLTNENIPCKEKIIKFVESHDSYYEFQYTKSKSDYEIALEYLSLTSLYPHTLYYVRPYDNAWTEEIIEEANRKTKTRKLIHS